MDPRVSSSSRGANSDEMTSHFPSVASASDLRAFYAAPGLGHRAPRMEWASGRRVDRGGDIPLKYDPGPLRGRMHRRHGGQQHLGVGMLRVPANGACRSGLDHAPQVHDDDALAEVLDHCKVVGNEQVGQAVLALDVPEQVDHLGLDADIEGADRFVADDELRFHGQRSGDADALTLSPAELVGVSIAHVWIEADAV